jgi:hypothetical protein
MIVVRLVGNKAIHGYQSRHGKAPVTYCGKDIPEGVRTFSDNITCPACLDAETERGKRFVKGWGEWQRRNPEKLADEGSQL